MRWESSRRPRPPAPDGDWALFLDVDGCLLDFAGRPDGVTVPPGLLKALESLSARLGGALALVSGRSLQELDAIFDPLRLPAAGLHGLERRACDGHKVGKPQPAPGLADVHADARQLADAFPGALVEDKGAAIALHWRQAPRAGDALSRFATAALARLPGYRLQSGDHVAELRPGYADKGDAIAAFLGERPFSGRHPVFAGDDLTDEHGFDVVNNRGGISVLVGAREGSAARYALPAPADVRAWLGAADGAAA